MQRIKYLVLGLMGFLAACSKDDTPNQVGEWQNIITQTNTFNDTLVFESIDTFTYIINADGTALIKTASGNISDGHIWELMTNNQVRFGFAINGSNPFTNPSGDDIQGYVFDILQDTPKSQHWRWIGLEVFGTGQDIDILKTRIDWKLKR